MANSKKTTPESNLHNDDRRTPNVFLLRWNPAISSFTLDDYRDALQRFDHEFFMNWSVWQHEEAHEGDIYFMLREGDGINPGIVFSGEFHSEPYKGDDWRGTNKPRYYVDIRCTRCCYPDERPIITTEELEEAIPGYNWRIGHSGELLTEEVGAPLVSMWLERCGFSQDDEDDDEGAVDLMDDAPFDENPDKEPLYKAVARDGRQILDYVLDNNDKFKPVGAFDFVVDGCRLRRYKTAPLSIMAIVEDSDDSGQVVREVFPYVENNTFTGYFKLMDIQEYANGLEAVMTVKWDERKFRFYNVDYLLWRDDYTIDEDIEFALSGLIYDCEVVPKLEQTVYLSKAGADGKDDEELYPFHLGRTVSMRSLDGGHPADVSFQTVIVGKVKTVEFFGRKFYSMQVVFYERDCFELYTLPEKKYIKRFREYDIDNQPDNFYASPSQIYNQDSICPPLMIPVIAPAECFPDGEPEPFTAIRGKMQLQCRNDYYTEAVHNREGED
jgi:hypothetical protein